MRISPLALALGLVLALGQGCILANMTPTARFNESAHDMADACRWGQVNMAMSLVSPKYSDEYLALHREWGGAVTIADAELVRAQVADDKESAVSEVNIAWTSNGGVTLHQSTLRQKWVAERGKFQIVEEIVGAGDPAILAPPPEKAPEEG